MEYGICPAFFNFVWYPRWFCPRSCRFAKYFEKNKASQKIRPWYLIFTLFVVAVVGGLAGVLSNDDWRLAVIVGYAGTDFLEGFYKIRAKQGFEN